MAMVDPGTQESMAERGAWVAMVDPGTQEAMAERGAWVAMMDRGAWVASMAGSPPPKFSWGNFSSHGGAGAGGSGEPDGAGTGGRCRGAGTGGRSGSAHSRGRFGGHRRALARSRHRRALARSRHRRALSWSRHRRALSWSRHRRALSWSRHRRALSWSRHLGWDPPHPLIRHQQAQGHMSVGRWACGGWRAYVSRERPLTSHELRAYVSHERPLTSRERWAGRAAGGVEGPPRTADQDQLRAAAALLHLFWVRQSVTVVLREGHGRREVKGIMGL